MLRIIFLFAMTFALHGCIADGQAIIRDVYIPLHSLVTNPGYIQYYVFHTQREATNIRDSLVGTIPVANPCSTANSPCGGGSVCSDVTAHNVKCTCPLGYNETYQLIPNIPVPVMLPNTKTNCADINECIGNSTICGIHTKSCINLPGTYNCTCKKGYMLVAPKKCIKYDPCYYKNCHANSSCVNHTGTFQCMCNKGFTGNGTMCSDHNECTTGTSTCSVHATCTNTIGGFTCACKTGFTGNGITCTDINECLANTHTCSAQGTCYNIVGSYTCKCNTGYTGDGISCTDINECKTPGGGNCTRFASCLNTPGSFQCNCNQGFVMNGFLCQDINECTNGKNNCHQNATCTNQIGSFTCKCIYPGFAGDGTKCFGIAALCSAAAAPSRYTAGSGNSSAQIASPSNILATPGSPGSAHPTKTSLQIIVLFQTLAILATRILQ